MTTTLSSKGQVVLPAAVRRRLGLRPGTSFRCTVKGGGIVLTPDTVRPARVRYGRAKDSGLVYVIAPPGAPVVTSEQIAAAMEDFP